MLSYGEEKDFLRCITFFFLSKLQVYANLPIQTKMKYAIYTHYFLFEGRFCYAVGGRMFTKRLQLVSSLQPLLPSQKQKAAWWQNTNLGIWFSQIYDNFKNFQLLLNSDRFMYWNLKVYKRTPWCFRNALRTYCEANRKMFKHSIWPLYPRNTAKCWMSFACTEAASDELKTTNTIQD